MDNRESFIKSFSRSFKENNLLYILIFLLLAYSLFLRLFPLNIRTLEYDEIYTVSNFVPLSIQKIFTDVATPNNHMLHTFFVKLFHAPHTDFFQLSIRLCCALAGTFTLLLFLPFRKYFQTLYGILFAILLFAFNGAHIHYSQTARGYSLLTFFLLLTLFSLWKYEKRRKENAPAKSLIFYAVLYFLSACAASVSVSSGVIFAFAVSFSFLLFYFPFLNWKKELKSLQFLLYAFSATALFILCYFLPNAAKFAKGSQDFGTKYTSLPQIGNFLYEVLYENDLLYPLLLAVISIFLIKTNRKRILFLLFSAFTVLLFTLLTGTGPARVYLPLTAFLLPAAALGMENILLFLKEKHTGNAKKKGVEESMILRDTKILSFLIFLLFFFPVYFSGNSTLERLTPYDMNMLYYELENNPLLADSMPVFHPTDSVALRSLHERDASGKILKKLSSASSLLFTFPLKSLPFTARDKETTCAMSFPELPSPVQKIYAGKKFLPHVPLQQVTKPYRKNEIIFLFVFLTEEPFTRFISKIQELQEFKYLNYLQRVETDSFYAGLFAAKAEEVTLSPEEMATLEEETQGRVRFRMLKK